MQTHTFVFTHQKYIHVHTPMLSCPSFKTGLFKVVLEKHIRDTLVFPCHDCRIQFVTPHCPTKTHSYTQKRTNIKEEGRKKRQKDPITPPKRESRKDRTYIHEHVRMTYQRAQNRKCSHFTKPQTSNTVPAGTKHDNKQWQTVSPDFSDETCRNEWTTAGEVDKIEQLYSPIWQQIKNN